MYSVIINGDKTQFKSKNAINRFKKDLKNSNLKVELNHRDYFNEGYFYNMEKKGNDLNVSIITEQQYDKIKLKEKLRNRTTRTNLPRRSEISKIRKSVPKNVLKSYQDLMTTFNMPIPSPLEIMENPDMYKQLIQMYASGLNLTADAKANIKMTKYFKSLANMLNIEPLNPESMSQHKDKIQETIVKVDNGVKETETLVLNDEDTEEED